MVYEQGDAGKAISFQSVQVLRGRGTWGQQPPLLRGPEPWERGGRKNGREKGPAWNERQRPDAARQVCSPVLWEDAHLCLGAGTGWSLGPLSALPGRHLRHSSSFLCSLVRRKGGEGGEEKGKAGVQTPLTSAYWMMKCRGWPSHSTDSTYSCLPWLSRTTKSPECVSSSATSARGMAPWYHSCSCRGFCTSGTSCSGGGS